MITQNMPEQNLIASIEVVFFDFDGVFTDNTVYVDENGIESVQCSRADGLGVSLLRQAGMKMFILSTEINPVVSARASKLQLEVFQGCEDKRGFLKNYIESTKLSFAQVAFVGNDLNDLPVMQLAGIKVCPSDAHPKILEISDVVLSKRGGKGAVREFCEMLLEIKYGLL